ncbi:MAG: glycosyltransferase [Methanobrevibacter sp.]|uniref:glycosyltransferase n=1 Tax=Methanobrevibacter sp. TaxID=66852 RepID=UPI0026E0FCC0|nr:glycosyltransferase [Methanobrevibacter sp.]MDO5848670.1 glycosyltransferase [Methanobrevibacter sp.]
MAWLFVLLTFFLAAFKSSDKIYQKVAVILPAFNEEENVKAVIDVISKVSYVDEIIVVDDGSTDGTAKVATDAGAIVISHEVNKGKGEAIKTGYNYTNADIIAFIDADISNLTKHKVDAIIRPILDGKTEITKTKFARASGRVTELTAKPLLNFFFPEISFEQPLSGQFAAKKSALKKINFEPDYGVDVGIVLDADVHGISIEEVDIGEIEHDMSPLSDLHIMANEVVRTIMDRANKYGRVVMIDDIGFFIRMLIVGLSLIILGLFTIFFVKFIPLAIGVFIVVVGMALTVYYLIKVIAKSISMFKRLPRSNLIKSFIKIHFPVLISLIILVLMISTFLGAATFENGSISIEPTSRNLIIFSDNDNKIAVRGPFSIDSAIENESNIIRVPSDALDTLGLSHGDLININKNSYIIDQPRPDEDYTIRLPMEVKQFFNVHDGDSIQNSRLNTLFDKSIAYHNVGEINNISLSDNFEITDLNNNAHIFKVSIDNESFKPIIGCFEDNNTYLVSYNNVVIGELKFANGTFSNQTYSFDTNGHKIEIEISNETTSSVKYFLNSKEGKFLEFNTIIKK